MKPEQLPIHN